MTLPTFIALSSCMGIALLQPGTCLCVYRITIAIDKNTKRTMQCKEDNNRAHFVRAITYLRMSRAMLTHVYVGQSLCWRQIRAK